LFHKKFPKGFHLVVFLAKSDVFDALRRECRYLGLSGTPVIVLCCSRTLQFACAEPHIHVINVPFEFAFEKNAALHKVVHAHVNLTAEGFTARDFYDEIELVDRACVSRKVTMAKVPRDGGNDASLLYSSFKSVLDKGMNVSIVNGCVTDGPSLRVLFDDGGVGTIPVRLNSYLECFPQVFHALTRLGDGLLKPRVFCDGTDVMDSIDACSKTVFLH
jgi:hypothetical protein